MPFEVLPSPLPPGATVRLAWLRIYFALDVTNDPATVPCGISGSPVRIGWTWGQSGHDNCYVGNEPDRKPHWFVLWHEMGHNFNFACTSFAQFCAEPSGQHNITYVEGLASLAALWAWQTVMETPGSLDETALDSIDEHYAGYEARFRAGLGEYQEGGAIYDAMDPDIIDGILMEMYDAYGTKPWYDLFSTFLPSDEGLPVSIDTREKQATWIVAALSASSGEDLRTLFTESYGFPVDNDAWSGIYSAVAARIAARPYVPSAMEEIQSSPQLAQESVLTVSPNPFYPRTEIRFSTVSEGRVELTLFDSQGRWVATLVDEHVLAGLHTRVWDGRDGGGQRVSRGAYFVRLRTERGAASVKVTLLM